VTPWKTKRPHNLTAHPHCEIPSDCELVLRRGLLGQYSQAAMCLRRELVSHATHVRRSLAVFCAHNKLRIRRVPKAPPWSSAAQMKHTPRAILLSSVLSI